MSKVVGEVLGGFVSLKNSAYIENVFLQYQLFLLRGSVLICSSKITPIGRPDVP